MDDDQTVLEGPIEDGMGMPPANGEAVVFRYTVVPCAHGALLVDATERGVRAVALGKEADGLMEELRGACPAVADLQRDDDASRRWADAIVRYLEGATALPAVPLDLQGTGFQRRVWRTLQQIPYGETRTYSDVAAMMGRPKAARAVARACASNKVAFVVPCHRVVQKDGGLGGYRWGHEIKARLIQQELGAPLPDDGD